MSRSLSTLSLPPQKYNKPKGALWTGTTELNRFSATYAPHEEVFEEYMDNKSLRTNQHHKALASSSGLLELHYDTMRKRQKERAARPAFIHGPTMDRAYAACGNYGGFIPGKLSNNIVGCSWGQGSRIAHEVRGKNFDPPMSGVTYTFAASRSRSSPDLAQGGDLGSPSMGSSASSPWRVSPQSPPKLNLQGVQQH
eukprot:TRINITY_DN2619_c0_g1_i1.p1 TRINITY_DN2619_c0_g1~~TRINITY_DN2619_c0_g1_i1.p1  ORF type:complete len:196 (-),score=38.84 TRINITY_DN2619_c0_g1_i1:273-860(-)